jgi:cytochrome c
MCRYSVNAAADSSSRASRTASERRKTLIMQKLLSLPSIAIAVWFAVAPGNCAEPRNAAQGEHAFMKCALCHARDKTNGVGPGLLGVIGRRAASEPGLGYAGP